MKDALELVSAHFYGTITDEQFAELSRWIRATPENANEFARAARLHTALGDLLRGASNYKAVASARSKTSNPPASRPFFLHARFAFAACLLLATILVLFHGSPASRPPAVARVVETLGAQWQTSPASDGRLNPGGCILSAGLAKIEFACGARVIVQGPANFSIAANHLHLFNGQMVVTCPTFFSRAIIVDVDGARITDLGTEYGVAVLAEGASVIQVFQGSIRLNTSPEEPAAQTAIDLGAGEARRIDKHLQLPEPAVFGALRFVRDTEFQLRAIAARGDAHDRWLGERIKLLHDPDLRFWTNMTPSWDSDSVGNLADPAATWIRSRAGYALAVVPGLAPARPAARFLAPGEALHTTINGRFESLTLAAWVRLLPENPRSDRHRAILMSDGWAAPGKVHWQIKGNGLRLSVFARSNEEDPRFAADTDALLNDRWHFLASVITTRGKPTVEHYIDGERVYRRSIPALLPSLEIGSCSIGGWAGQSRPEADDRTLHGDIADLFVWGRALHADEIRQLFNDSGSRN